MLQMRSLESKVGEIARNSFPDGGNVQIQAPEFLRTCRKIIEEAHNGGESGLRVCSALSLAADIAIGRLTAAFVKKRGRRAGAVAAKFCIVALGGYGRSELCPKSDIDIMILYSDDATERFKTLIVDEIMYPLWNTGFVLGHSSRTIAEAVEAAQSDILARNAMLDSRPVAGNLRLFSRFKRRFERFCRENSAGHFDALMRLKRDRHERYNWTPYLQEPNVKNGVGGLRDFQTMSWKTFLNFGTSDIRELVRRGIISVSEYASAVRARNFLLRVRNDMHYLSGRENDLLDLETQSKIARRLGFCEGSDEECVEAFMRRLYFAFRDIDGVAKTARKRMGLMLPGDVVENMRRMGKRRPRNVKFTIDGFTIWRGEIDAIRSDIFKRRPKSILKVFLYCQKFGAAPSDSLEVLIKDSRKYIDDNLRASADANALFLKILANRGEVFPVLELMHYWGVLDAFIPEFSDITCLVQHEFYHRYTADVHILNSIAELDKVFLSRPEDGFYGECHKVLISLQSPHLAYLMLLLHDIGKADGIRGHAEVGAEIGSRILERLGVSESDAETILFVVRNHLEMARFAQSNDVEDEKSVAKFASIVGNKEHLKFLYVVTFCDAMATSDGFWNSYKQSLHSMLYGATLSLLEKGESGSAKFYERRKEKVLRAALTSPDIAGLQEELCEHIENLPRNYFYYHGLEDLVSHVHMVHALRRKRAAQDSDEKAAPVIEWRDDPNRSISRLCVVSTDRSGLFAILSGVLTLVGLNILASKILTRDDGITIDTFYVSGVSDGVLNNPRLRDRFSRNLNSALKGRMSLDKAVNELFYSALGKLGGELVGDVFMRRESGKLVVEVFARDCVGLLYKLAKTISECGYDIEFARVNTEGKWGHNTFHISPRPLSEPSAELAKSLKNLF